MRHPRTLGLDRSPPSIRPGKPVLAGALAASCLIVVAAAVAPGRATASPSGAAPSLSHLSKVTNVASTVPPNGDLNPYGITVVPRLVEGDTLVSNFNNAANLQGTGTTIVEIAPSGTVNTFAQIVKPLPGPVPVASASAPRSPPCPAAGSWWAACRRGTECPPPPGAVA
jgi:hypothetical protein